MLFLVTVDKFTVDVGKDLIWKEKWKCQTINNSIDCVNGKKISVMYYSGKLKKICIWNTPIETLLVCYVHVLLDYTIIKKKYILKQRIVGIKSIFSFSFRFFFSITYLLYVIQKILRSDYILVPHFQSKKKLFGIGVILIVFFISVHRQTIAYIQDFYYATCCFWLKCKKYFSIFYSFCSLCLFHLHKYPTWTKWKEKKRIWRAFNDFMFSIA